MTLRSLGAVLVLAGLLFSVRNAVAETERIAVLPIVVHSEGGHDYLRAGLADMLTTRLEQMPGLRVVRVDDPEAATTELEAARQQARALGAGHVLFGSFTSFGEGASLDVQCAPVEPGEGEGGGRDGEPVRQVFIQSGSPGELIPRLDELADKVARYVLEGPPEAAARAGPGAGRARPADGSVDALRRRIEALERAVYEAHPERRAEPPAAGANEPSAASPGEPPPAGAGEPPARDRLR